MCSSGSTGFYPTAFYSSRKGLCVFDTIVPVRTLEAFYEAIQFVISKCLLSKIYFLANICHLLKGNQEKYCINSHQPPVCNGHRCKLGACLKNDKICNGRFDCHDGSDETEAACNNRETGFVKL